MLRGLAEGRSLHVWGVHVRDLGPTPPPFLNWFNPTCVQMGVFQRVEL